MVASPGASVADVSIVRLAFLLLCLAGGFGVVLYVVLWLALPDGGGASGVARSSDAGHHRIDDLAVLAVVAGLMLVLRDAGIWFTDGAASWAPSPPSVSCSCGVGRRAPMPCSAIAVRRRGSPSVWRSC